MSGIGSCENAEIKKKESVVCNLFWQFDPWAQIFFIGRSHIVSIMFALKNLLSNSTLDIFVPLDCLRPNLESSYHGFSDLLETVTITQFLVSMNKHFAVETVDQQRTCVCLDSMSIMLMKEIAHNAR